MKSLVFALKKNSPNLFHKCPYQGIHEISNFTVPQNMISIWPVGFYRTSLSIVDESSKTSLFLSLGFEVYNWKFSIMMQIFFWKISFYSILWLNFQEN